MRYIRTYFLNRLIAANKPSSYPGWKKAQKFLILCGDLPSADLSYISKLKERLEKEGKTINLITFVAVKRPKENVLKNAYYTSDINWFALPKVRAKQLVAEDVDVVIDWTNAPKSANDFLVLSCESKFKIGVNKSESFYDLVLQDKSEKRDETSNEILKYLKLINNE